MMTCDCDQLTAIFKTGMVYRSFNIQYQNTGIGSLPSLDEIELRQTLQGVLLWQYGTF